MQPSYQQLAQAPNMENGGRWHHICSEAEVARALRDKKAEIIEVPAISMTFIVSRKYTTIIRAGALGGDSFNVEGGWRYRGTIGLLLDRQELVSLAENTSA